MSQRQSKRQDEEDWRRGPAALFVEFFDEHGDALVNACSLLGGPAAGGRVIRLRECFAAEFKVSRYVRSELVAIHGLLASVQHEDCIEIELLERALRCLLEQNCLP